MSSDQLKPDNTDRIVALVKGALNLVPFAGGFLQETVTSYIPNQRIDRVAEFSRKLAARLQEIGVEIETLTRRQSEFAELLEEGIRQAAASDSSVRRSYLAKLIAAGIQGADRERLHASHLLKLLAQMSDLDVATLARRAGIGDLDNRQEAGARKMGSAEEARAVHAFEQGSVARLIGLGLMAQREEVINEQRSVRYSVQPAARETRVTIEVTAAGWAFLEYIDTNDVA